jgi:hypothetical protein
MQTSANAEEEPGCIPKRVSHLGSGRRRLSIGPEAAARGEHQEQRRENEQREHGGADRIHWSFLRPTRPAPLRSRHTSGLALNASVAAGERAGQLL